MFSLSRQVYFILFASFALAALQNVTVDDAVLTGGLQYLPSDSAWHQGNNCTICLARPNPSLAYNGTWHDATFRVGSTQQEFEFTFTGSALYIFFITTNIVTNDTAVIHTDVQFVLDGISVSRYTHDPSAVGGDYQYNVPVYVNGSLVLGEHTMLVQPVESENFQVLMLFDYLIYTMDTSVSVSSTASLAPSASSTSPSAPGTATSSKSNIGAIVGGTVGGVAAVVLVVTTIWCRRRSKKSVNIQPPLEEGAVEPFVLSREMAYTPLAGNGLSTYPDISTGNVPESTSRNKTGGRSSATPQPLIPPAPSTTPPPAVPPCNNETVLLEEVEQLRDEVARLRDLHDPNREGVVSEAPPEYSQGQDDS